ncbi:MAG: rRNA maturation RNase YbeY [Opitutales bacterium]|nr:rRNA maturation RNase YbeY [Opitutales bacterium]NRA27627.1 rRNA maturation RNase YbeY [Opitutales bacterium]
MEPVKRQIEVSVAEQFDCVDTVSVKELFERLDSLDEIRWSIPDGELSIALVDEATICEIHARFLDDPTPTDVITFPGDTDENIAGEIIVSVDQAMRVHQANNTTLIQELTLYLVHGWLHLAGEDDIDPADRMLMRQAEKTVLKQLGKVSLSSEALIDET